MPGRDQGGRSRPVKPILVSESLLDSMHRDVNCSLDLCLDIMINIFFFFEGEG